MSEQDATTWLERLTAALEGRSGVSMPGELTSPEAVEMLLEIARNVAHGTERRNAPLATAMVGGYVTLRTAQGVDAHAALREAFEIAAALSTGGSA